MIRQYRAARQLADSTPPDRNRYADFLRALAILAVVVGHWLMAAVWVDGSGRHTENLLGLIPATQWMTWALQVMPIFFFVGGFSNSISWAHTDGGYGRWLRTRLQRLVIPTIPLIALWGVIGTFGPALGIDPQLARIGSQTALIPLWFLAVYVLMAAATPVSLRIWDRFGTRAVVVLGIGALATDAVRALTTNHVGFLNYLFVWGAIYLLGHAWAAGRFAKPARGVMLALFAAAGLVAMTLGGPYHLSMVGVPGVHFGNTAPPSAALLALGLTQIGLAIAVQGPAQQLLQKPRAWTATILINGSIMTIYLWHMTAMTLTIAATFVLGGPLLSAVPGSIEWWVTRPLWISVLAVATVPFILLFQRLERPFRGDTGPRSVLVALAVAAAMVVSYGSVAAKGIDPQHPIWAASALLPLLPASIWLRRDRARSERSAELSVG